MTQVFILQLRRSVERDGCSCDAHWSCPPWHTFLKLISWISHLTTTRWVSSKYLTTGVLLRMLLDFQTVILQKTSEQLLFFCFWSLVYSQKTGSCFDICDIKNPMERKRDHKFPASKRFYAMVKSLFQPKLWSIKWIKTIALKAKILKFPLIKLYKIQSKTQDWVLGYKIG